MVMDIVVEQRLSQVHEGANFTVLKKGAMGANERR